MRSRPVLFGLLFVVGAFALPFAAYAAIPFFGPIVPQGRFATCPAGWGAFIIVINNIISLLITLAIVFVAPIMIAWSGFLLVVNPFNAGGKEQARKILTNTIVGIVIALAGWMIVDALMVVLYNPNAVSGGTRLAAWSQLITSGGSEFCLRQAGSSYAPGVPVPPPPTVVVPPTPGRLVNGFAVGCSTSNDQNVATLVAAGVSGRSTNNCCIKSQSTCTSLDGMLPSTIQQIINVKNACGGAVVTGGTEVGHSSEGGAGSHSSGSKVDISANLISCVLNNGGSTISPPSFGSSQTRGRCNDVYTWEGNHTDIYVVSNCTL